MKNATRRWCAGVPTILLNMGEVESKRYCLLCRQRQKQQKQRRHERFAHELTADPIYFHFCLVCLHKVCVLFCGACTLGYPGIVYDGVLSPPPGAVFRARLLDKPRVCQYRTMRLRKALGETYPTPDVSHATAIFSALFRL